MSKHTDDGKRIRMAVAAAAVFLAVLMAAYSYAVLPSEVATQFQGALNTGAFDVPKWAAIVLPLGIVTMFAVKSVSQPKSIAICLIGYIMNILLWLSN